MQKVNSARLAPLAVAVTFVVAMLSAILLTLGHASAATTFSKVQVRFDHMKISTPTSGMVCANPTTTSANVKTWTVTFPTGYTVSPTAANWQTANISTTNLPTGAVAWPNATVATATISTQTVTWTNASVQTMTAGTTYCYNWTSTTALLMKSTATSSNTGTVATQDNTATTIDSASYSTASLSDDSIVVSAQVPQTFQFALSQNADNLLTLTPGTVKSSTTATNATISTNAKNGYSVWANDTNAGLNSPTASKTIPSNCSGSTGSNSTLSTAAEGYNTGAVGTHTTGTGTLSIAAVFNGSAAGQGGGLCSGAGSLQLVASSTGTAANDQVALTNNVNVIGTTPAATDYTDTITVVGAGLF